MTTRKTADSKASAATTGKQARADAAAENAAADSAEAAPVSGNIELTGSLGIAEAEATHHMLGEVLQANVDIVINAGELSRVDAAGVQLLYAFVREAQQRSIKLSWQSVSDALRQCAAAMALEQGLGLPS